MPIERFYPSEDFSVVAHVYEDLAVVANGALKEGERTGAKLVLFDLGEFIFAMLR